MSLGRLLLVLGLALAAATSGQAIGAERRIALVIGMDAYEFSPKLKNPGSDAAAIAEEFRQLGFDVDERHDLTNREISTAVRDFGIKASDADVAVLYYAGHGIQVNGQNYLIPADAELKRARDLVYEAMPLALPLGEVSQARQIGIVILDACRNNPFAKRLAENSPGQASIMPGLARVDDTSNTFVAMSTRFDSLADDGLGDHSPFTAALLQHLKTPGVELGLLFRQVRDTVMEATDNKQEPYTFGSLGAKPFYFNPQLPNRPPELGRLADSVDIVDIRHPTALGIGAPRDPDGDTLAIEVVGVPRGGAVLVGGKPARPGDLLTPDQLASAAFQPDGSALGEVGSFAFSLKDNRDGVAFGNLPIKVRPLNHPPVVVGSHPVTVVRNRLRFEAPEDPDGDVLTITVTAVPEVGRVINGGKPVAVGDRLTTQELTDLAFDPGDAPPGRAGAVSVVVDDGRGGQATSSALVEVGDGAGAGQSDDAAWATARDTGTAEALKAYAILFPKGAYRALAESKLAELQSRVAASQPEAPATAADQPTPSVVPVKVAAPDEELDGAPGDFVSKGTASVRQAPKTSAPRIGLLRANDKVRVLGGVPKSEWYAVILPTGERGYVSKTLVSAAPQAAPAEVQSPVAAVAAEKPAETVVATAEPQPAPGPDVELPSQAAAGKAGEKPPVAKDSRMVLVDNTFRDCSDCPLMVPIEPGSFVMGTNEGDRSERPAHRVTISDAFALGAYEVTVAEYRKCVEEGGCASPPRMNVALDNLPAYNLDWDDAQKYVSWLTKKTGFAYRLPSEGEWEYAARAGTTTPFWWGDAAGPHANCQDCGGPYERLHPLPVGTFGANGFGLYDMNGSVAEWTEDCWFPDYANGPVDAKARELDNCHKRTLRGGSWRDKRGLITNTSRWEYDQSVPYVANGFRVSRKLN